MNVVKCAAAACVIAAGLPSAAQDGVDRSTARGQMKSLQCVACHGPTGVSPNPLFPHLAGQNAAYLEIQLERFKAGDRYHPLMTPVAQSLSRQDVVDLATYFSSIGPLAAAGEAENEVAQAR